TCTSESRAKPRIYQLSIVGQLGVEKEPENCRASLDLDPSASSGQAHETRPPHEHSHRSIPKRQRSLSPRLVPQNRGREPGHYARSSRSGIPRFENRETRGSRHPAKLQTTGHVA